MPGLISFLTALVTLVATGAAAFAAASFLYGGFHWIQGDHERGKRHIVTALIGAGIVLTSAALGTGVAGLAHA